MTNASNTTQSLPSPSPKRILVFDDHPTHLQLMLEELQTRGNEVVVTGDKPTALAYLEQGWFDLVITDSSPGLEVLRDSVHRSIPAVVVSGKLTNALQEQVESLGAIAVFSKPYSLRKLGDFVQDFLARSKDPFSLMPNRINRSLSEAHKRRLQELIAQREAESLTPNELRELVELTDRVEELQAERIEALAELAELRGVTLATVMAQLGIRPDHD